MKQFLPGYVLLLMGLLVMIFISCEQTLAPEEIDIEENHLLPKQGNDLIPHIESDINHTPQAAEKSKPNEPNWKRIEAAFRVLNILNSKDDSYYYAFISVKNKNENGYRYKYIKFKPDEEAKSGAEDDMLYNYTETTSESDDINLFMLAQIPNTEIALQKVRSWYNTGTTEPSNNSENRLLMNSSQACSYEYDRFCYSTGDPDMPSSCWTFAIESCPSEELEEEDGSGVGSSYEPDCYGWDCEPIDPTGGGGSYDPDDSNEDPTDTECPEEDEGEDHGQDEGNLTLDSTCSDEEEVAREIILDPSFVDTKAECVYNSLSNLSNSFAGAIQKFEGEFPVSHIKFIMDDLGTNNPGETRPPINLGSGPISPDYVITIALNNNSSSKAGVNYRPNLLIAKTLIHEVIHAEMFRKLMSLTQKPNFNAFTRQDLINMLSNGNYPGIYNFYMEYETNWQHQLMAEHYRHTIANVLEEYDNYNRSYDFYLDLSWEGLMTNKGYTNVAWENLADSEKTQIEDKILFYIESNKYEACQI